MAVLAITIPAFCINVLMNYHLISDTHFNHSKLEEWGGRTGNWQYQIICGLNEIPDGDMLIHLGDICIGDDLRIHDLIETHTKGVKRILIRGNHDKKSISWYETHGWSFACDGIELIYQGHYLHLTHRPARQQGNTTWNIHGHTHGHIHRSEEYNDFYSKDYHIDISPEIMGFKPIRLDSLLKGRK